MKKPNIELTNLVGKLAAILSILMFIAYVPQIIDNLSGNKGNPIQPFVAMINCSLWVSYGFLKEKKDKHVIIANGPGVALSFFTFLTSL